MDVLGALFSTLGGSKIDAVHALYMHLHAFTCTGDGKRSLSGLELESNEVSNRGVWGDHARKPGNVR